MTQLWERFLPGWRSRSEQPPVRSPETEARLMADIEEMAAAPEIAETFSIYDTGYVLSKRKIPVSTGKWRILPPGIEDKPCKCHARNAVGEADLNV